MMETEPQEIELPNNPNIAEQEAIQIPDIAFYSQLVPTTEDKPSKNPDQSLNLGGVSGAKDKEFAKEFTNQHFVKIIKHQDGGAARVFECGVCAKEFSHQYTLMRHIPTHTDERKFTCETCGKAFRQLSTLSQHKAIHSAERPHTCVQCNKTFNRVSTLISHKKTHSNVKPHQCHLCDKSFHQKGNLRNHIFTHTNKRPYKCDICDKGFNQMSNMMCHKLKDHQHFDVIPKYTCKTCGEEFLKRISLRQHEHSEHNVGDIEATIYTPSRIDYSNSIIVDPIKTEAMRNAIENNKTPFALLRPLSGMPVLVRVLSAGSKQLLVPATADDLKKYGQISISSESKSDLNSVKNKENQDPAKPQGSIVQIKVPVVATVIQRPNTDGPNPTMNMSIISPGPADIMQNEEKTQDFNLVFSSSLPNHENISVDPKLDNTDIPIKVDTQKTPVIEQIVPDVDSEFLDKDHKAVNEDIFNTNQSEFEPQSAAIAVTEYPTQYTPENIANSTAQINFNNIVNNFVILNNPMIAQNNFAMPNIQSNTITNVNENLLNLYPNMASADITNTTNQFNGLADKFVPNNVLPFSTNIPNYVNAFNQSYASNNQLTANNCLNMFPNMMPANNLELHNYAATNFDADPKDANNFNAPAIFEYKSIAAVTSNFGNITALNKFKVSNSNMDFLNNGFETSNKIPIIVQNLNNHNAEDNLAIMNNFSTATVSSIAVDTNNKAQDFTKAALDSRMNMDEINNAMMAHFNNMCNGQFLSKNTSVNKTKNKLEKVPNPKKSNVNINHLKIKGNNNENTSEVKKSRPAKDMPLLAEFESFSEE